ncbi:hypothetical protein NP233_g2674 [Leucocoprinus birnbaumii]|uniref:BTB domain-containing protein n=1 Tax=Leucocoprinus birnbaumii TaxID=56174 RepID=A0AAD5W088_9AGAR|nr:hypothetical protein NP233_g2674 [Leucocoprinus birnbaumii]
MPRHDEKYYFDKDPMVVFLVEDRLFRVHRYYLLAESQFFQDMFSIPPARGQRAEGQSDARAVTLPDVKAVEFEALMDYLYTPPHQETRRDRTFYLNLLSISHRFLCDDIFHYCVRKLSHDIKRIPVLKRLRLGEKYDLAVWQSSALNELAARPELLSDKEAKILGLERILLYTRQREAMHKRRILEAEKQLARVERKRKVPKKALPTAT